MSARKRLVMALVATVVAALALGWWVDTYAVTGSEVTEAMRGLNWTPLPLLIGLAVLHVALAAWRWSLIEESLAGQRPAYRDAFAGGALALGLGAFLPPPLVNVACRGLVNKVSGSNAVRGAVSGAIDQASDFAAVALLAVPAFVAFVTRDLSLFLVGSLAIAVVGAGVVVMVPWLGSGVLNSVPIRGVERVAPLLRRGLLLRIYAISLLRVANLTLITLMIQAMTGAATAGAIIITAPLVTLAISLAMLPGAFGISEWSFSVAFAQFAIPAADIVVFVIANRIVLTGVSVGLATITAVTWMWAMTERRSA